MRWCFFTAAILLAMAVAQDSGPYKILQQQKAGGDGRFDYVYADVSGRRLYIPRMAPSPKVTVFNLDTLAPEGEIPNVGGHGVAVDPVSGHGFASSNPIAMWDAKTLHLIKSIPVQGGPDGIHLDPFNGRIWVFSHRQPNATIIDAKDGSIVGTMDLGGAPEEAVSDGNGKIFVALEDKDKIAVVDAKTLTKTGEYSLDGKGGGPAGLAFDSANHVLFATCHEPAVMVILNSDTGKVLDALPISAGTDGGGFNPNTMEAFSSGGSGKLTVIKENSPTSFSVEQNLPTMSGAKTMTVDTKTNHVILIAAQFGPPPANTPPNQPWRRGPMVPGSFTILVAGK